jgi:ATP diphosphatase
VTAKIAEEAAELAEAAESGDRAHLREEYGDLMFVMANLARHLDIDPESALRDANLKFTRRFRAVEAALAANGRTPSDSTLEEMDAFWDAVKRAERDPG